MVKKKNVYLYLPTSHGTPLYRLQRINVHVVLLKLIKKPAIYTTNYLLFVYTSSGGSKVFYFQKRLLFLTSSTCPATSVVFLFRSQKGPVAGWGRAFRVWPFKSIMKRNYIYIDRVLFLFLSVSREVETGDSRPTRQYDTAQVNVKNFVNFTRQVR